ncbi:MAG: DUF4124 domain-containing protein [Pseudomonas sp.]|uniref:DUF4124 domain-containing protein n=1 Tax=Pseudomonas sp. TaxID=306 RepID=UPI0033987971
MRRLLWCVVLLPGLASAEIYRWTDAQGQVHFGERPVAGGERVDVKPQVVERDDATREREARAERFYQARRDEQVQAADKAAVRQGQHKEECQALRSQLAQLSKGGRYYSRDEKGEPVFHSDTEIDTARRQLSSRVAERCD